MAIDEVYLGKKTKYLTLVMDLVTDSVVYIGDGKSADALKPFWKKLKCAKAKIEALAMDMGRAYIRAVKDNLPGIPIVFDHFHVIKLYNEKLTELRRDLQREAEGADKEVLKGTRWLLLKSSRKLNTLNDECDKLKNALKLNEPLAMAYYDFDKMSSGPMEGTNN